MVISSIIVKNKKVLVKFKNSFDILTLDFRTYTSDFLYVGKDLDIKRIKRLQEASKHANLVDIAISYVSHRVCSIYQLKNYLKGKGCSYKETNEIILYLKEHKMIDDMAYIEKILNLATQRNLGKYYVIHYLYKSGIDYCLINGITFNNEDECKKAENKFKQYLKMKHLSNDNYSRTNAFNYLCRQGFDGENIRRVLNIENEYD